MPLLLTPTEPFAASTAAAVPTLYAIILKVEYDTRARLLFYRVGYFLNEQAYLDLAESLRVPNLPSSFSQQASAQEANAVPIFNFLEQVLTQELAALLPGATIANVG